MKKLMMGLALTAAAAMATPALANSGYSHVSNSSYDTAGYGAYAYMPGPNAGPQNDTGPGSFTVYIYGQYQGADPDPFIRGQLRREGGTIGNGGD